MKTYLFADFDGLRFFGYMRVGGPGLGNLLFPWARSVVHQHCNGGTLLEPFWGAVKPLRLLRRDPDQRSYGSLFKTPSTSVSGVQRWKILQWTRKVTEQTPNDAQGLSDRVIFFSGMKDYFNQLRGYQSIIKSNLLQRCSTLSLETIANFPTTDYIGVHVRLGDFAAAASAEVGENAIVLANTRTKLDWYVTQVMIAQKKLPDVTVLLFSDGEQKELTKLLSLSNVRLARTGNALADLIGLSQSKYLIGSRSTFSLWSAYLGHQPAVFPQRTFQLYGASPNNCCIEQ
jgi:hypothetical protein